MKNLFINPYLPYPYSKNEYTYNRIWPPLSLLNSATILNNAGFESDILDCHALRIKPGSIAKYLYGYDNIFITSSPLDKWQCPNIDISWFMETIHAVARITSEFYVLGYHGTVEPYKILDKTNAKAVILGEPESVVLHLCSGKKFSDIRGICFKQNNNLFYNAPDLLDMKTLPIPNYSLLNPDKYSYEILGDRFFIFEFSRGCKFKCKFCNKIMYGDGVRTKNVDNFILELKTAIEDYGVKNGYFIDLDFLANGSAAEAVCDFLISKKYKFRWTCQTRIEFLKIDMIKKLKEAGCSLIHIGFETRVEKFNKFLDKNFCIDDFVKSVELCKKNGIKVLLFVLFGFVGETQTDMEYNFNILRKINSDFISLHKVFPYAGSPMALDNYMPVSDHTNLFIKQAYMKYYFRINYLVRMDIKFFFRCLYLLWGRIKSL